MDLKYLNLESKMHIIARWSDHDWMEAPNEWPVQSYNKLILILFEYLNNINDTPITQWLKIEDHISSTHTQNQKDSTEDGLLNINMEKVYPILDSYVDPWKKT